MQLLDLDNLKLHFQGGDIDDFEDIKYLLNGELEGHELLRVEPETELTLSLFKPHYGKHIDDIDLLQLFCEAYEVLPEDQIEPFNAYLANNGYRIGGASVSEFRDQYQGYFASHKDFILSCREETVANIKAADPALLHHIDWDTYFDSELSSEYWEDGGHYFNNF